MNNESSKPAAPGAVTQLAAGIAAIVPMAALTVWMYLVRDRPPGLEEFFLGPLLVGGGMIFWLLFLHVAVCRDTLHSLGFRVAGLPRDVAVGIALGVAFLLLKSWVQPWLSRQFPPRPPSEEVIRLIRVVVGDPWLLALWLGPVVWIGIAGFEELWRVVVLRRFWNVLPGTWGRWSVLLLVSALIGLAHGYQGPAAAISIGFKSVLMGAYFMVTDRTRPLIVCHAVYDSVQVVMAVVAIRGGP